MWTIDRVVCLVILLILTLIDIREHKVPVRILVVSGIGVIVYHLIGRELPFILLAGGIAIGVLFLLIGKVTDESIGYGDGLGIMILGAYLGTWKLVEVLVGAFLILGICSILVLWIKKLSRGITLPFFPFLMSGYILVLLTEGGIL